MTSSLHADQIVFDGLIVANWGPDIFLDMRRDGLTAASCTWEGFTDTMRNIARWNAGFHEYPDLIVKARTAADIRKAKENNQTGIVLGFQNVSAFEDQTQVRVRSLIWDYYASLRA
jgi:membrane dipeptidase